jgi:hypothetical protein
MRRTVANGGWGCRCAGQHYFTIDSSIEHD